MRHFFLFLLLFSTSVFSADLESYFFEDYVGSRDAFIELSVQIQKKYRGAKRAQILVPSQNLENITMDYLYVPASGQNKNLVVLTSGVHGVEGFAGASMQRLLMQEFLIESKRLALPSVGLLFVHAVNPHGFKYKRRVTENNVDLNRNCGLTEEIFSHKNPGYTKLLSILQPERKASSSWLSHLRFLTATLAKLATNSMADLRQAIAGGQYEHEKGLFFGGTRFEPQKKLMEDLVVEVARPYQRVLFFDFHTGYGKRGFMHLLPNPVKDAVTQKWYETLFGDYPIEEVGDDFYESHGDFATFLADRMKQLGKQGIPMLVEYGTLDSQKYSGSIASLSRMILENQKHWHGATSARSAKAIDDNFLELFYPSAKEWRTEIAEQTRLHIPKFIENLDRAIDPKLSCVDHVRFPT